MKIANNQIETKKATKFIGVMLDEKVLGIWIFELSLPWVTVMSDEILKELGSKIYYAITKIRNDRKRAEINAIHKEVIKTPVFKDITKDRLQDRVDKLLKNGTLLNKPNRDKDSLRLNRDKINYPIINISSLSTHSPPAASPTAYRLSVQTQTQGISQATP